MRDTQCESVVKCDDLGVGGRDNPNVRFVLKTLYLSLSSIKMANSSFYIDPDFIKLNVSLWEEGGKVVSGAVSKGRE